MLICDVFVSREIARGNLIVVNQQPYICTIQSNNELYGRQQEDPALLIPMLLFKTHAQ